MSYSGFAPYSPLGAARAQQLDDLLRRFPGCKAINPDRSVFDLPLELKDKKTTALRISLPPHFPQERPGVSVLLPVVHPAVDGTGRVHTPLLSSWVYGRSTLVDAVAEAAAALTDGLVDARQPGVVAGGAAGVVPYPAGYPSPVAGPTGAYPQQQRQPSPYRPGSGPSGSNMAGMGRPGSISPGPVANGTNSSSAGARAQLPDLSHLSVAELEELMTDEAAFQKLVREVVNNSPMAATLEDIRVRNRQLAQANMGRQDAINEVRNQLAVVKSSEYTAIRARFNELHARQDAVVGKLGGLVFKEALEDAVSEADASSGAVAAAFLGGQLGVEQFVGDYVEQRTKHHVLDLKRQAAEHMLV